MKRIVFVMSLMAALGTSTVMAQNVTVDDAEGYADTLAVQAKWGWRAPGVGQETVELGTSDGADGSTQWLRLVDTGYGAGVGADDLVTPPAGTYKLSFYYQNGIEGGTRWRGLNVGLLQGGSQKGAVNVNGGTAGDGLNAPAVEEWTYAETDTFVLDGSSVSMLIKPIYASGNGANSNCVAAIDEIELIPLVGPAMTVFPDSRVRLSGTETIVASPAGGSGTYSSVTFDVDGDGTIEYTANAEPFEFSWDTLNDIPANTSGTKSLKVTVTDSDSQVKDITETYTIDNEYGGRDPIFSSDFTDFTDGTNFGANVPVGWVIQAPSANATFGPDSTSHSPEAGTSLRINMSATDYTDRYSLRSEGVTGNYRDVQVIWWGKGSSCRLYYCKSEDDGATFEVTSIEAGSAGADWTLVVPAPASSGNPATELELTDTTQLAVATHMFAAGDCYWDDISVTGNLLPTSAVSDWKLY